MNIGSSSQWKNVIMAHQVIISRLFTTFATPVFSSPYPYPVVSIQSSISSRVSQTWW